MSHTPGPWEINETGRQIIARDGYQVAYTASSRANGTANARLIAAAPEMLEALMLAEEALEIREQAEEPLAQPSVTLERIHEIILKAIGKAE